MFGRTIGRNGARRGRTKRKKHFMAETVLVWLRNDLRITDNTALAAAVGRGGRVVAMSRKRTQRFGRAAL